MVSSFSSHESKAHHNVTVEAPDPQGGAQIRKQQRKISCLIITRQSWLLVLFCSSLVMQLKQVMVRGFMTLTRLHCYCTKHMARPNMPVILLYLAKLEAILSKSDAHDLKWNRTFNKHGLPGINIPVDLQTEQYNHEVKSMWNSLGANINEDSAVRVANTVEPMEVIQDSIRRDLRLLDIRGYRSPGNPEVAVLQVIKDLVQIDAFKQERTSILSFPEFSSNLLKSLYYRNLHTWMNELLTTWEPI